MAINLVSMISGNCLLQLSKATVAKLYDLPTDAAHQMVMVAFPTEPIGGLPLMVPNDIDQPRLAERPQRPVHGGEANLWAAFPSAQVNVGRAARMRIGFKCAEHSETLWGPTKPALAKALQCPVLHGAMIASPEVATHVS